MKQVTRQFCTDISFKRKKRPLLVFSIERLSANCREFAGICDDIIGQGKWEAYFPLKVAGLKEIAAEVNSNGFGAEIISIPELKCAQTVSFSRKILSGNAKSDRLISSGIREGGWRFVVCESLQELTRVNRIAHLSGIEQDVLLRLKLTPRRRLGMPPAEILKAVKLAKDFPYCRIVGVHVHPGSNVTYEIALKTADAIESMLDTLVSSGFKVEYINFGSGLPALSTGSADLRQRIQTFNRIAVQYKAKVIIEPGRPLIGDAACLVASVIEVRHLERQLSINTAAYVLHGSCQADAFVLYRRAGTEEFTRVEVTASTMGEFRICGIWPAEGDSLWVNGIPDNCAEGDDLIFPHAGAYILGFLGELSFEPLKPLVI